MRVKWTEQNGRYGFSTGPCRSIQHCLYQGTNYAVSRHSLASTLMTWLPSATRSFILQGMPMIHIQLLPTLLCSQLTTPLQPLSCVFLNQHTGLFRYRHSLNLSLQPGVLPLPLLPDHPPHAYNSLHLLVPYPSHAYTFPPLFPRPAKPHLFRAILTSCSCLLLVPSVTV